jgi:hypothetical protein
MRKAKVPPLEKPVVVDKVGRGEWNRVKSGGVQSKRLADRDSEVSLPSFSETEKIDVIAVSRNRER